MTQKLAEVDVRKRPELRKNTQQYKIQQIWNGLNKTEWEKETNWIKKNILKGELYSKTSQMYEMKVGKTVKRSTIRRCVNSLINKAK